MSNTKKLFIALAVLVTGGLAVGYFLSGPDHS